MRELVQFIGDLRNARARDLEQKIINKEPANIRQGFDQSSLALVAKLGLDQDHTKVKTLIDWGADQPCINKRVAVNVAHSSRIPTDPYLVTMPQESLKELNHIHILQAFFVDPVTDLLVSFYTKSPLVFALDNVFFFWQ